MKMYGTDVIMAVREFFCNHLIENSELAYVLNLIRRRGGVSRSSVFLWRIFITIANPDVITGGIKGYFNLINMNRH